MENEQPKTDLVADDLEGIRQIEMEGYALAVKKARNALYWTACLLFVSETINWYNTGHQFDPLLLIIVFVEVGLFAGLALWTKKKPYNAVVSGLCAFIGIILLSAVLAGMQEGVGGFFTAMLRGLIFKIIIIIMLANSFSDARALQTAMEENK